MEQEHTFTELCHYCMAQGITRDPRAVRKAVNKMKRRKIVSEKNGVCRALIDPKNIKAADIERMCRLPPPDRATSFSSTTGIRPEVSAPCLIPGFNTKRIVS